MIAERPGEFARLQRLRWRCRRGMRELDHLLAAWVQHHAPSATTSALDAFEALLDVEDHELWAWCLGRSTPSRNEWSVILEQIRSTAGT